MSEQAFVILSLGMRDGGAESAALQGAGIRKYIKMRRSWDDQLAYAVFKDHFEQAGEEALDMLAVLGVQSIWHIDGSEARLGTLQKNYMPGDCTYTWAEGEKAHSFKVYGRTMSIH